ncbi:MAG: hypothetical protein E7443_02720 [Ruminococcaceae bacterium]|nr:hypothetical protein [Oscillospiraceae bacterium]
MSAADKIPSVRSKAELLLDRSLGENGDALTSMVVLWALAYCGREDVPEAMELPLAQLVAAAADGNGTAVKALTRGDTSITYDTGSAAGSPLAGLAPFRRLRRLGRDDA